jgi:hypothetical protein
LRRRSLAQAHESDNRCNPQVHHGEVGPPILLSD